MRKNTMKLTAAALTLAFIASGAACGTAAKKTETTKAETTTAEETTVAAETVEEETTACTGTMVGGWTIKDDESMGDIPEEVREAFDKASETYVGMDFTPVAYLGSQVVAGTNYMLLCKGTTVTATPETRLVVVTVYEDLSGNAEITNAEDFDLGTYAQESNEADTEQLAGGWTVFTDQAAVDLTADEDYALCTAVDSLYVDDDTMVEPLACLGTQVVSGTNYAFLCRKTVTPTGEGAEPVSTLCVYYVYAPISGDAEVSNIYYVNPAEFNQ